MILHVFSKQSYSGTFMAIQLYLQVKYRYESLLMIWCTLTDREFIYDCIFVVF